MFELRADHIRACARAAMEDFEDRVVVRCREAYPHETEALTDEDLHLRAREACERAGRYGLESEYEVITFLEVSLVLGRHFDEDPSYLPVQKVLVADHASPKTKADWLRIAAFATVV